MRPVQVMPLLLVIGVALSLSVQSSPGAPRQKKERKAAPQSPAPTEDPIWSERVEGRADNIEVAEEIALMRAQSALQRLLGDRQQAPSTESIKAHLVKSSETFRATDADGSSGAEEYAVSLFLELTPTKLRAMVNQDRQNRVGQRTLLVGKGLAGIVAVLMALAGYLRLEEATKGCYTTWLRVAAVGFVLAVGAGLLLVVP